VIPRGGYRLEDMVDDDVDETAVDRALAATQSQNASAEVREARGLYLVQRSEAARR